MLDRYMSNPYGMESIIIIEGVLLELGIVI